MLGERFENALLMAVRLHRKQKRKGTQIPYVTHLMAVCGKVLENGGNEDEAIAALLHDAIEDQPRNGETEKEIGERFGPVVLAIVKAVTKAPQPPGTPLEVIEANRQLYYRYLAEEAPPAVLLVAAADKVHNAASIVEDLKDFGPETLNRFKGGKPMVLSYYENLAKAMVEAKDRAPKRLVLELLGLAAAMMGLAA